MKTTSTTRKAALRIKAIKYNTGQACINGHLADRYTATYQCVECHKLRHHNRYGKLIRDIGEEEAAVIIRDIWKKNSQRFRDDNKEKQKKYMRDYMRQYVKSDQGKENVRKAGEVYRDKNK